ncbi:DNA helicase recq1, putative [Talaromyces stipitatus ATCC 10500]|uniref:DNA 3'-5' helicase n=1 Tax=Talaromyces stipitatus (strain ATCC 10500 / CBS 375.48 / QM 6759 / NRRL 1006) TaxID=441959 RepID=B8MEZ1_TALSN|nr:DNA helicase recq1, putative [Talaromyces stipitatus ATCC 10500]EED17274.1 DNA helicase recq1, putative [Talaromyces stipitatus ATCC 10500]
MIYVVQIIGKKEMKREMIERLMMEWIEEQAEKFRHSRGSTVEIAHQLQCPAYHSKTVDRRGVLASFCQQKQGVMVATSALGMGIDIPDIQMVVHVGPTRTLLDYGQESGRAGRDGRPSLAVMLIDGSGQGVGYPEVVDERVRQYIDGRCRRRTLDRYLDGMVDGYEWEQCEEGEAPCDQCRGATPVSKVDVDGEEEDPSDLEGMEEADDNHKDNKRQHRPPQGHKRWAGQCRICELEHQPNNHSIDECSHPHAHKAQQWAQVITARITSQSRGKGRSGYEPYAACFHCHSPQWICQRWESNGSGGYQSTQKPCQYEFIAVQVMAQLLHGRFQSVIQAAWGRRLAQLSPPIEMQDMARLVGYFQRRFGDRGEERSGLVVEMNWMCEFVEQELQRDDDRCSE